jgi:hypothetical protein
MRYLVEPTPATELKEGDIIYSPDNTFRAKKVSQVTESHVIVYYTPRFKKTTTSIMCPNDEKFSRVIEIQE